MPTPRTAEDAADLEAYFSRTRQWRMTVNADLSMSVENFFHQAGENHSGRLQILSMNGNTVVGVVHWENETTNVRWIFENANTVQVIWEGSITGEALDMESLFSRQ